MAGESKNAVHQMERNKPTLSGNVVLLCEKCPLAGMLARKKAAVKRCHLVDFIKEAEGETNLTWARARAKELKFKPSEISELGNLRHFSFSCPSDPEPISSNVRSVASLNESI